MIFLDVIGGLFVIGFISYVIWVCLWNLYC